jgi:hypothetical protein
MIQFTPERKTSPSNSGANVSIQPVLSSSEKDKPKHVAKSKMATDPRLNLAYLDLISLSVGVWKLSVSSSIAEFSFKIGEAAGKSWFS